MNTLARRIACGIAAMAVAGAAALGAAGSAAADTNDQDLAFIQANAQTNLAEITLGELALERAQYDSTRELAQMTLTDHQAALGKLQGVAADLGVTLPDAPNAEQQSQAATLKATDTADFDAAYAQIQVAGHQKSIAATNAELAGGSDASVLAYAEGYLPVATHHLEMAQDVVAEVGTPTSVPAGSGGLVGSTSTSTMVLQGLLVVLGVVALGFGLTGLRRRSLR